MFVDDNSACFSAVPNDPLVPTAVLGEDSVYDVPVSVITGVSTEQFSSACAVAQRQHETLAFSMSFGRLMTLNQCMLQ